MNISHSKEQDYPFFSIVLPTKNRSEIIHFAIDSVLNQDFSNYELLVIDNDDTDNTANLVQTYLTNSKVKYFKTGNLSMAENWNYGFRQVSGKYILVIEDKFIVKPHALKVLHDLIILTNPYILSWKDRNYLSVKNNTTAVPEKLTVVSYASSEIISWLLNMEYYKYNRLKDVLPRGFNSCIKYELYQHIFAEHGALSMENAPDYTLGYQVLFSSESINYINYQFYGQFTLEKHYSIGALHDSGNIADAQRGMNSKSTSITEVERQPLNIINTDTIIIEDFLRVAELYGKKYIFDNFNSKNYFETIYLNTLNRFAGNWPSQKDYFRELCQKIINYIIYTKYKGWKTSLIKVYILNIFYLYPRIIAVRLYHSIFYRE